MKRYNNLFGKVCSMDNIAAAHAKAKRGKGYYKEVRMVESNPDFYLQKIRDMLLNKTFKNSPYKKMSKITDNGKVREILKLPYYPDRIIHHAIMNVIEPIWFKTLIRDTYSAIKTRGIHDGVTRVKNALQDKENTQFCLKLDVKKYYPSINNELLKKVIRKKIKDNNLLWLLDEIINSTKGVPIGNYLSQYFGNLFLSGFDHWIKEQKREKYYFRYCDDIVILGRDKAHLHNLRNEIAAYLSIKDLTVKKNWQIFPVDIRGIDFLGYRFFNNYTLVRKSISKKLIKRILAIKSNHSRLSTSQVVNSIMSYMGWLKYGNAKNLFNSVIDNEIFCIVKQKSRQAGIHNPLQGLA